MESSMKWYDHDDFFFFFFNLSTTDLGRSKRCIVSYFVLKKLIPYYRQTSSISHTLLGSKIVDHSDVDGALPDGAAPTTSSFLI